MKLPACLPRHALIAGTLAVASFPLLIWLSSGFAQVQCAHERTRGQGGHFVGIERSLSSTGALDDFENRRHARTAGSL